MDQTAKVLVTGASGFIGTRLVQKLVDRGNRVRALSRRDRFDPLPGFPPKQARPLDHENVEVVRGDITDAESVDRATEGCQYVFSLAGLAQNWAKDMNLFYEVNVQGTRNVLDAVQKHRVERVVVTSTVVTLGPSRGATLRTEDELRITSQFFTEYERTKYHGEQLALKRAEEGGPVVIVNPTRVYGPGYLVEANSVSKMIDMYDRGLMPFTLNGGRNFGNWALVDDVADGMILAMEKGRLGQKYLLGGENASLEQILELVDEITGRRHFQLSIPSGLALSLAWCLKKRAEWFGIHPVMTPGWIRTFLADWAYSTEKSERELGYRGTPLAEGVRLTYDWLMRVRKERKKWK